MTKREMVKPFSWGVVLGAAAVTIVAFSAGWVVTSGSRDAQVQAALIEGQAAICTSLVQAHRLETGDVSDLYGYQAREARDKLAKTFAVALPGKDVADSNVVRACSEMLNRRST